MAGAVKVKGLRETVRAFNKLDRTVTREVRKELKQAAEPVRDDSRGRISKYRGSQPARVGIKASGASIYVTQRARKVSGQRGDYGLLQQRHLEDALDENQGEVRKGVEDALDRLARSHGF